MMEHPGLCSVPDQRAASCGAFMPSVYISFMRTPFIRNEHPMYLAPFVGPHLVGAHLTGPHSPGPYS